MACCFMNPHLCPSVSPRLPLTKVHPILSLKSQLGHHLLGEALPEQPAALPGLCLAPGVPLDCNSYLPISPLETMNS